MPESFQEKRRRELGMDVGSSPLSFQEKRKMDLGMIPDTRPQNTTPDIFNRDTHPELQSYSDNPPAPQPQIEAPATPEPSLVDKGLNVLKSIDTGFQAFKDAGANALTLGLHNKLLQHNYHPQNLSDLIQNQPPRIANENSIPGKIGEFAGMIAPLEGAYATGGKLLSKLVPNAPKIVRGLVRGVGAGATYGLANEAVDAGFDTRNDGSQTLGQRAANVGLDAAIFGAGDAALSGLGTLAQRYGLPEKAKNAITSLFSRGKNAEADNAVQSLLALPEGRGTQRINAALDRANLSPNEAPIAGEGRIYQPPTLALPEGNYIPPTRLKVETNPDQLLNRVMEKIKPIVQERMTPPMENPNELAKWVRDHLGIDNISLNEVRKLSYDDLTQLAGEIKNRISVADVATQVAKEHGYNLPKLLERQIPTLKGKLTQDAQARVYGVYPETLPKVQPPNLNQTVLNPVAAPRQRVGFNLPKETANNIEPPLKQPTPRINSQTIPETTFQATHTIHPNAAGGGTPVRVTVEGKRANYISENGMVGSVPVGDSRLVPIPKGETVTPQPQVNAADIAKEEAQLQADTETEVVPRIRDRINSAADQMIQSALNELKSNRLSSNPLDIYAKLGAGYMLKGTVKLADFTEALVKDLGEQIRPLAKDIWYRSKDIYKNLKFQTETEELGLKGVDATKLKDVSNLNLNTSDVYRNFRNVFKGQYDQVKKAVLDPFDEAKAQYVQMQNNLLNDLRENIVKKLGIQKGSKWSALVQKYGEKQIMLDELKKQAPNKWKDIVKADQWFRQKYDQLINDVNKTVQEIYPTRPEKIVPKRDNYYRHFRELNGLSGLKNLFDTPSQIDPKLSGISPFTEPKTKWASFKQKRGLGEFKNDAVGGFLEYIPAASYAIHIDPQIGVFRNLAKNLAEQTTDSRNINNFIKFLNNFANDLAGKTSPFDRWVEEIGVRKTLSVLHWANNRVKSNVILGNVRSAMSQLANIPQGIAFAKQYSVPGATRTMMSIFEPNPAMTQSKFLKERYLGKEFRKFDSNWLSVQNPLHTKRFAEWMMEFADRVGTSFIWNSAYAKAIGQKITNPIKFADDETRRLVAGRGIGEVPLLQKSKVFQLIAPFQLEVANLWKIQKDFVSKKDFVGIAALYASSFLLNKAYEQFTGNGVVFDPIDAVVTALTQPDLSPLERFGRVGGEILSNVPLGQNLAAMYPEYGTTLYGMKLPTRKNLFGDKDPTRFGEGLVLTKGLQDPLFKMLPGFGGNQLKKSIQGLEAVVRGGSYTQDFTTTGKTLENPQLKFKVDSSKPGEVLRSVLLGATSTKSGQEYFNKNRRPLSDKQTQQYLKSKNPDAFYENLMRTRKVDSIKQKISNIKRDRTLTPLEKQKEVTKQISLLKEAQQRSK